MARHPEMSAVISEEDEDMLSYMTNLKVKEEAQPSNCSKISLFFRSNPYFHNALLVKEFVRHTTGYRASRSTPIQWCAAYKHRADSRSQQNRSANFFNWFTDHTLANCKRITQIILEDLWLCPLSYYYSDFKKTPEEGAQHTDAACRGQGPMENTGFLSQEKRGARSHKTRGQKTSRILS